MGLYIRDTARNRSHPLALSPTPGGVHGRFCPFNTVYALIAAHPGSSCQSAFVCATAHRLPGRSLISPQNTPWRHIHLNHTRWTQPSVHLRSGFCSRRSSTASQPCRRTCTHNRRSEIAFGCAHSLHLSGRCTFAHSRDASKSHPVRRGFETLHQAIVFVLIYDWTVTNYGNTATLHKVPWHLAISVSIQGFSGIAVQVCRPLNVR